MSDKHLPQQSRVLYLDILKTAAVFAVVVLHVTGKGLMAYYPVTNDFNITLLFNSFFRFAVPIFVMCSGALFLNPEKEVTVKSLFFKYLPRIISALAVFSVFYETVEIIRVKLNTGIFDINTFKNSVNNLLTFNTHYHLYYLYIVIILYLSVPFFKTFLKSATEKNVLYILTFLFVFSIILPFFRNFYPLNTYFQGMTLQYSINLTYGMLTYFVLGYYLSQFNVSQKATYLIYALGIVGLVTTFFGTSYFSLQNGVLNEIFLAGNSPNVFFCTTALFLFIKRRFQNKSAVNAITFLSKSSFCIYLIHDLFIIIFDENNLNILSFSPIISVPLMTIAIIIPSIICYLLLRKIPLIKKLL